MVALGIVVIIAFVIQSALSMVQMKHFSNEFIALRRKGKVAVGRKSGGFHAGAIVMFLIDEKGMIQEGKKLEGVTILARVKVLPGFEGRYIGDLKREDGPKNHRNLCRAIEDAALTYRKYMAGEEIPEPPSPIGRVGQAIENVAQNMAVRDRTRAARVVTK
ncbi:MAG: transcriptional regulator GutM [Lachnospiraceae bacterium]|nr:transcriptional regulator GutM [Lachnospiraceae bacterium]